MLRFAAPALSPELLHERYATKIDRLIRQLLGHDAEREDLRHDVLMTVFRKAHTLRDPRSLDFWVTRVTINTLKYAIRQRRLRRHASFEALPETLAPRFQMNVETRELAARALHVLEQLPASDRLLLLSYWFSVETAQQIARRTGCSIVTVRRRLFRARCRFERLARQDPELARSIDEASMFSRRWRVRPAARASA